MLLPDRKTLKPLLEEQKFQSAKEGIALAQRVDALRREFNELKVNREVFIAGTVVEIEKATKAKSEALDSLQRQIEALEARKEELLKPLHAEWQEVNQKKEELEGYVSDLDKRKRDLDLQKEEFIQDKETLLKEKIGIALREQETERLNLYIKQEKLKAEKVLKDAIANRDEIEKECSERLLKVSELENQVDFDKQANENEKKIFIKQREDLVKREILLKDREQMYLRKVKRDKKNGV